MLRKSIFWLGQILERTFAFAVVIVIWELLPRLGFISAFDLPPFSSVIKNLVVLLTSGKLTPHIVISLSRVWNGFSLSLLVGIPLGFLLGWSRLAERILDPLLHICRNTATLALYPLFILVLGLGEFSKAGIIFWGAVFPVLINTIESVKGVDPLLIKSARSMGAPWWVLFGKVLLPSAFPTIFTGIRLSASRAIIILVGAEMLGADKGLGYMVFRSEALEKIPDMYACIIVLIIFGVTVNYLLVNFEKYITRWKEEPVTE
jgi:NitT/TauT family transport system permease protein